MIVRRSAWAAALVGITVTLAACAPAAETPTPLPPAPEPGSVMEPSGGPVQPVGEPAIVATDLALPWSIAFTDAGSALISERDTALVKELPPGGAVRVVGQVTGVVPGGEGGLLGLATLDDGATTWLYAYLTAADDNRVVRMPLTGAVGSYGLGDPELIVDGIEKAGNHNGGRIKFGPDGMLYVTTGDASRIELSQDPDSLNGKILRLLPDGAVPGDNPASGSLVYSLGHRNPQGIAWDADGQLWAAEFGQNTWDEFNRILPGSNYGWPVVEGTGDDPSYVNPEYQWATSEASPSGLAFAQDTFFLAALRGERVWALYPGSPVDAVPYFQGQYGRIRDVVEAPDGMLWMITSNTGGNGSAREGDDQLVEVQLAPLTEG